MAFERFTDDGPMALLPLPDNRCALVWTRLGMDAQRLAALDDRSFLGELQGIFGYRLGTLKQVGARHLYPLSLIEAEEQVRPHLAILGNAAHSLHPIAGQGFNLSLRDAQALADNLLGSETSPGDFATLQAYRERQRLDQSLTVGFFPIRSPACSAAPSHWFPWAATLGCSASICCRRPSAGSLDRPWAWVRVPMFKRAYLQVDIHDGTGTLVTRVGKKPFTCGSSRKRDRLKAWKCAQIC